MDAPRELWMDHAIVQETSPTYQEAMTAYLEAGSGEINRNPAFLRIEKMKKENTDL